MFISDQEANERLNSSKNVLTVIDKDGDARKGVVHDREPLVIPAEDVAQEDQECASADGILEAPDGKFLKKLLGINVSTGRKVGQVGMPKEMQAACATTAQLVNTRTAAGAFGVSPHHADELKHGYTNQKDRYDETKEPDADLEKIVARQKKDVRDLAFEKLTKTLGLISDEKLLTLTDPTKLGRLARDLSGVVDKVLPKEATQFGGVHFHVWRPDTQREETSYPVVNVGAPV
jgi:hypothetical protein